MRECDKEKTCFRTNKILNCCAVNSFITGTGFIKSSTLLTLKRNKERQLILKFHKHHLPCQVIWFTALPFTETSSSVRLKKYSRCFFWRDTSLRLCPYRAHRLLGGLTSPTIATQFLFPNISQKIFINDIFSGNLKPSTNVNDLQPHSQQGDKQLGAQGDISSQWYSLY